MSNPNTQSAADQLTWGAQQIEERIAHYDERTHKPIIWAAEYIREEHKGSLKKFQVVVNQAGVQRAPNTWYQIFSGIYFRNGAGERAISNLIEQIEEIRRFAEKGKLSTSRIPFIETSTWFMIEDYIDALRAPDNICRFGIIVSDTGTQKTACLEEYRFRNNHGTTVRFEAPAKPVLNKLLHKWLKCYTPRKKWGNNAEAERELRYQLNERKVVIVENAQRLFQPSKGPNQELFSFLQEIQEETGCVVILCWTRTFVDTFFRDDVRVFFEQFVGRVGGTDQILSLPELMPAKDLRLIAKKLNIANIDQALPILKQWAKAEGKCRVLFSKLQKAKRYAEADGLETITIDHLEEANVRPKNALELKAS